MGNRKCAPTSTAPPGSIYRNGNRLWWSVHLPGTAARASYPLIPGARLQLEAGAAHVEADPGGTRFATADVGIAQTLAWAFWHQAVAAAAGQAAASGTLTLALLVQRFLDWAPTYYRNADGEQTGEADNLRLSCQPISNRWPELPAVEFQVRHLLAYRHYLVTGEWLDAHAPAIATEAMPGVLPFGGTPESTGEDISSPTAPQAPAGATRKGLARSTVNQRISSVQRMFGWACGEAQLLPSHVSLALDLIRPLKRGRSAVRETEPVEPVEDWAVEATLPYLTTVVRAMVQIQRLTGMRSTELCRMTPERIGRMHDGFWVYHCRLHKTRHKKHSDKSIALGPQAQGFLGPLLVGRGPGRPVFSPAESEAERRAARHAERKTPAEQGNGPGTNRQETPEKTAGDAYDRSSYYNAIRYGIRAANKARAAAAAAEGHDTWVPIPHWHPHQLRHNAADSITENADLAAAAAVLGHDTVAMTAHYARNAVDRIKLARAIDVARKMG
jgi:integrase